MAQDTPSRTLDKVIVRLPDGMRDRIAKAAKANNRSMNAEIVARLEVTFQHDDLPHADLAPLPEGTMRLILERLLNLERVVTKNEEEAARLASSRRKRQS